MKKIIAAGILSALVTTCPIISMTAKKSSERTTTAVLADFFNFSLFDSVSNILDEIKAIETGKTEQPELQKCKELARLYKDLADKPQTKSPERKKFMDRHNQNLQKMIAIEKEMTQEEENIKASLNDTSLPALTEIERYTRAIAGYERLASLAGDSYAKKADYIMEQRRLEKLRLRKELHDQVDASQSTNNKQGMCIAYRSLLKTYNDSSDEQALSIQEQLAHVEKTIAQEKRDEDIKDLTELITKASARQYCDPAARLVNMANLVSSRADVYKEDDRYQKEYTGDLQRAHKLALQAAGHKEYAQHKKELFPHLAE